MQFCELNEPEWSEWLNGRPQVIKDMAAKYPPNVLFRLPGERGNRCHIHAYNDDGTVIVTVSGQFNRILFGRNVFGVDPATLVECDLPGPDEELGDVSQEAGYTQEDVENILIPRIREEMGIKACNHDGCTFCEPIREGIARLLDEDDAE